MKIITQIVIGLAALVATLSASAQELTWEQDEAVSDLKSSIREGLQAVLDVRANRKPDEWLLKNLISETEENLKACAAQKIPDTYEFETTNYNDPNQAKVKFSIRSIKAELPKWKSISTGQATAAASQKAAAESASKQQESIESAVNNFISSYDGREELFADDFVKKVQALDDNALYELETNGSFELPTRMDLRQEFKKCIDAKVPDNYVFEMGNGKKYTMLQLKTLVPKWASIAETAVLKKDPSVAEQMMSETQRNAKTKFESAFVGAMNDLDDVKQNSRTADWAHYQKWTIDPLKKALAEAKQAGLPGSTMIGYGNAIPFSEAAKKAETFEIDFKKYYDVKDDKLAVFKNTQGPENLKRYDAFRAKYTQGLSGDKLKIMDEILISSVVYAQDPPKFLNQYYDVGKKPLNNPADFANAKIWAMSDYVYANTDVLKTDPHWRIYISHFQGMKLVNTTSRRGPGTVAPTSEYVFQAK